MGGTDTSPHLDMHRQSAIDVEESESITTALSSAGISEDPDREKTFNDVYATLIDQLARA